MKNILIISAHADDHIACAGTIFKLKEKGYKPYEIVCTDSSLGQDNKIDKEVNKDVVIKIRQKELTKASKFLGIEKTFNLKQEDLGLTYNKQLMFEIVKIIRKVKPCIVFLHNQYDMHPDHLAAYKLGINAIKIATTGVLKETLGKPFRVKTILCAEGMLPTKSEIIVDISKFEDEKLKLLKIYTSQASSKLINFENSLSTIRGYQLRNGGLKAENFNLQQEFPIILF